MENMPDYSSKRFLIVDDEVFMLSLIERTLKECKAGMILKASDGGAALRAIRDEFTQVDCIISDYNMKPINGLQLLQGTRVGIKAAELVQAGDFGKMVALQGTDVVGVPIADAVGKQKIVPQALYDELKTTFNK